MKRAPQSIALAVALVTISHLSLASAKGPRHKVDLNIDEPTLTSALLRFTMQANLQMVFRTESTSEVPAPKLVGSYTPQNALATLLKGSGLEYEFINDSTVAIRVA